MIKSNASVYLYCDGPNCSKFISIFIETEKLDEYSYFHENEKACHEHLYDQEWDFNCKTSIAVCPDCKKTGLISAI
jgi:hypothetical protein